MLYDDANQLFKLAADFVHYSNLPIFITGKAGSGKTTFLKYIKAHTSKQTAVVAPTGVAAINAGGVTIHSFFQLPFATFVPHFVNKQNDNVLDKHHLLGRMKMNKERRGVLQNLELLIIDEISMVRCDVLDAIDTVLRHFRNRNREPFGGVQVLFIGDMFQLPPVVKDDDWNVLSGFYQSPYFFSSKVVEEQFPVCIEFDKIYRQNEIHFIQLLNKIRDNAMDEDGFKLLNSRMQQGFQPSEKEKTIILTTHNYKADATNAEQLAKLKTPIVTYKAKISGEFYERSYPAEETLQLKVGAQVMFIKNDSDKAKRYFNGKIGTIEKLEDETIYIGCKDEAEQIVLSREVWENIRYNLDNTTQKLEEEVAGSFTQFPLRLAWAITIHKSQGLTFEKAVIDAGSAFAPGQVYVALSRCTTLEGIILKSIITNSGLKNDEKIVSFSSQKKSYEHLKNDLTEGKKMYQQNILLVLFDLSELKKQLNVVMKIVDEHLSSFNEAAKPWLDSLLSQMNAVAETSNKFQSQLQKLFSDELLAEENDALQQRITAAANYFLPLLENIAQQISSSPAVTDSRQNALAYNEDLLEFYTTISKKIHALKSCAENFSVDKFHLHKNNFILRPIQINAYAVKHAEKFDGAHPLLYKDLREMRDKLCEEMSMPVYMIASSASIKELSIKLPMTEEQLMLISGFGKIKVQKFGKYFLDIINDYCEINGLHSNMEEIVMPLKRKVKKEDKPDTKEATFSLYKAGKNVEQIAEERKLTVQTIEGHLAHFVEQGLIDINELVKKEKLVLIEPEVENFDGGSIISIKQKLSNDVSFGEIRLTIAWKNFKKIKEENL